MLSIKRLQHLSNDVVRSIDTIKSFFQIKKKTVFLELGLFKKS
jgi:hypothetical protein